MHPLFGEETGEFIDFAGWSADCARILKVDIINVKPPKLGQIQPSEVIAEITLSLKDLKNAI
jgi:hypothetical protein